MNSEFIDINDLKIQIKRRAYQRSLRLNVYPDGRITLSARRGVSDSVLREFALSKLDWLKKAHAKSTRVPVPQFQNGEKFWLLGKPLQLEIVPAQTKFASLEIDRTPINNAESENGLLRVSGQNLTTPLIKRALKLFYQKNGRAFLESRIPIWTAAMNLRPTKIVFRGPTSRWGSCSRRGTISLSWKLLFAPPATIDYVIIHELAHLQHFNHSPKFWALVEKFSPDFRTHKKWLREHENLVSW